MENWKEHLEKVNKELESFDIILEVDMDYIYDYEESEAQQMLHRIANSVERNNKNDKYYVQHISTVSIIDEKGGMLWARN